MIYNLGILLFLFLQPLQFLGDYEEGFIANGLMDESPELHKSWDSLLRKYVDSDGNVNYRAFKNDEAILDQYLEELSGQSPSDDASREEVLVYYINLYNAATVKLILLNYPVLSIKEIKSPWDKKWIKVGEKTISLGHIEHKILRKLDEPRIHFAINCASYSCPKLINKAFTTKNLEQLLEQASREFVNDKKRNRVGAESAEISEIFKWYKSDFTKKGSLTDYINLYSDVRIQDGTKLKYIQYDWSLNEAK